jgi:hypothetical protein
VGDAVGREIKNGRDSSGGFGLTGVSCRSSFETVEHWVENSSRESGGAGGCLRKVSERKFCSARFIRFSVTFPLRPLTCSPSLARQLPYAMTLPRKIPTTLILDFHDSYTRNLVQLVQQQLDSDWDTTDWQLRTVVINVDSLEW